MGRKVVVISAHLAPNQFYRWEPSPENVLIVKPWSVVEVRALNEGAEMSMLTVSFDRNGGIEIEGAECTFGYKRTPIDRWAPEIIGDSRLWEDAWTSPESMMPVAAILGH